MIVERHFRLDFRRNRAVAYCVAELVGGDTDSRRRAAYQLWACRFARSGFSVPAVVRSDRLWSDQVL